MHVIIARNIGCCFGVKRAVDTARDLAKQYGRIYTYGELIHNSDVISELESEGIQAIQTLDEVWKGDVVLIRAHGVPASVYEECAQKGVILHDATCPFVAKIHDIVRERCKTRRIVIIGTKNHPETIGTAGSCDGAVVVSDDEDLDRIDGRESVCVVAQTTFMREKFLALAEKIKAKCPDTIVFDTICNTTRDRQEEAERMSRECDTMLVFGSSHSSNTRKLAEICKKSCDNVICVEHCGEDALDGVNLCGTVGIIGGASTPVEMIDRAINGLARG